jgi:hypothetical protein
VNQLNKLPQLNKIPDNSINETPRPTTYISLQEEFCSDPKLRSLVESITSQLSKCGIQIEHWKVDNNYSDLRSRIEFYGKKAPTFESIPVEVINSIKYYMLIYGSTIRVYDLYGNIIL